VTLKTWGRPRSPQLWSVGPDEPGVQQVLGPESSDSVHFATGSGDHNQWCVVGCARKLRAVYDEAGEVAAVKGCLFKPFDGPDAEDLFGDGSAVGDDNIDFWVVRTCPVAAHDAFTETGCADEDPVQGFAQDGFDRSSAS
jgi:hypothetical protein